MQASLNRETARSAPQTKPNKTKNAFTHVQNNVGKVEMRKTSSDNIGVVKV